jgi:hypothetical protein
MGWALIGLVALCLAVPARAQFVPETGPPDAAFAGGPIRLTPVARTLLKTSFPNDLLPLVPMPHRARLDAALVAANAASLAAAKRELARTYGFGAVLVWERTRFLATGDLALAADHARNLAQEGGEADRETAAVLWLYAVAAVMTDGARCADTAAREVWLDRLRGPAYAPVLLVIRTLPEDRLNTAREAAIRLEAPLAEQRPDDAICRTGPGRPEIRPIELWRPAAGNARALLPRHLRAMTSVLRPRPADPNPR